ncbi:MAG: hypothetical protein P8Q90_05530 [Candidatus Thalassarchaeaceae archaeon]|nr:hypothetical protein [Candidatus Thalassarchaeaceae archaeon]
MTEDKPYRVATIIAIILAIGSILVFIYSIILIVKDEGQPSAGPMAVTDGCCFGGIGLIASCALLSFSVLVQIVASNSFPNKQNHVQMIPPELRNKD